MKGLIALMLIMATITMSPDETLVEQYCLENYDGYPVEYVENPTYERITSRKGTVLVEVVRTVSDGEHGFTRDGYYVSYNESVEPGENVTSYLIYNPKNNAEDDVVAVIDNNKIR